MKKLSIILFVITFGALRILFAQEHNIKVVIENVKDEQGSVLIALYNSEEHYMKERFRELKLVPRKGEVVGVFENIPAGIYAISVMHDTNSNMELDKNAMGIPTEGFGFSNNAKAMLGPPDYKKASFDFPKQKMILIKLRY